MTPEQARAELAKRELARRQSVMQETSPTKSEDIFNSYQQNLMGDIKTQAGIAGATMLGAGAIKAYRQPWAERNVAMRDVMNLQQQLGLEQGGATSKIIPAIRQQATDISKLYGTKIRTAKENVRIGTDVLNKRLDDLNKTILNPNIDDLAQTIKAGYPQFKKDTYAGWRSGMDAAEDFMIRQGKELSWKSFEDDVLKGLDEDLISNLIEKYGSKDKLGKLTISQTKNIKNAIFKNLDIPLDERHRVLEKYSDFIEKNAPKEVKTELAGLNKNYKIFKELEKGLGIDTRTGVFNDEKLYKQLSTYSQRQQDLSTKNALKMLAEGTDLSAPIKDVKGKVDNLELLKTQKVKLENAITRAGASEKIKLKAIRQQLDKELNNVMSWKQAQNRIDRLKIAQKRVNVRSIQAKLSKLPLAGILKPAQNIAKIGGKVMPILGIAPMIGQAASFAQEFNKFRQKGGFLVGDLLGGTEQVDPNDIEQMMKYGLIG